jgi:hypothetical protein
VKRSILIAIAIVMAASWGIAETGNFSSFSTTVTPTGGGLDFDLQVTTTGATNPTTDDWVIFFVAVGPVAQYVPTVNCYSALSYLTNFGTYTSTGYYDLRGVGGDNVFTNSFSFTGLGTGGYKWSAFAFYYGGNPDITDYTATLSSLYYFIYSTVCPWLQGPTVTAGSFVFNIVDVSGTDQGVWRQGIIIGSEQNTGAVPVPALGTWGLLVLGVLLAGTGLFILRRV